MAQPPGGFSFPDAAGTAAKLESVTLRGQIFFVPAAACGHNSCATDDGRGVEGQGGSLAGSWADKWECVRTTVTVMICTPNLDQAQSVDCVETGELQRCSKSSSSSAKSKAAEEAMFLRARLEERGHGDLSGSDR